MNSWENHHNCGYVIFVFLSVSLSDSLCLSERAHLNQEKYQVVPRLMLYSTVATLLSLQFSVVHFLFVGHPNKVEIKEDGYMQ